jgi:aldehyde dehydrogenase (NAD+)
MATGTVTEEGDLSSAQAGEEVQQFVAIRIAECRAAQRAWSRRPLRERLRLIRRVRHLLVPYADRIVQSVRYAHRRDAAETLAAEVLPLADACRFLEQEAGRILASQALRRRAGRPPWLGRLRLRLHRDPWGVVLVVGAANYPVFLAAVQTLQAVVAGNAVLLKPGQGATPAAEVLRQILLDAGLDAALVQLLPESPASVEAAAGGGIDKLVLTGSAETGRRVLATLSAELVPAALELSGCDAVFILADADLDRVTRCLSFGLRLNQGATCIAPRRVFVHQAVADELERRLRDPSGLPDAPIVMRCPAVLEDLLAEARQGGAEMIRGSVRSMNGTSWLHGPVILARSRADMRLLQGDYLAPVLSLVRVASPEEALAADRDCPFALGAVVFGGLRQARRLAQRIDAGCVVINDMIAPTADPRVPFAGRRQSGFGATRGAAGLLEMTQVKAVIEQRGSWLPHLQRPTPCDERLLKGLLAMRNGPNWMARVRGAGAVLQAVRDQRRWWRQRASDRNEQPED